MTNYINPTTIEHTDIKHTVRSILLEAKDDKWIPLSLVLIGLRYGDKIKIRCPYESKDIIEIFDRITKRGNQCILYLQHREYSLLGGEWVTLLEPTLLKETSP